MWFHCLTHSPAEVKDQTLGFCLDPLNDLHTKTAQYYEAGRARLHINLHLFVMAPEICQLLIIIGYLFSAVAPLTTLYYLCEALVVLIVRLCAAAVRPHHPPPPIQAQNLQIGQYVQHQVVYHQEGWFQNPVIQIGGQANPIPQHVPPIARQQGRVPELLPTLE